MVFDRDLKDSDSSTLRATSDNDIKESSMERASRRRKKLLCELELLRRFGCQGKISSVLVGVQKASTFAMKEKLHLQENIWRETHAKYLKEEQEIYHKIHEEELEAIRRQEQIALEHEQNAKRVPDINQIIQEVEQKQKEEEERERTMLLEKKMLINQCNFYNEKFENNYKNTEVPLPKIPETIAKLKNFPETIESQTSDKYKFGTTPSDDVEAHVRILDEAKQFAEEFQEEVEINAESELEMAASEQEVHPVEIEDDMTCPGEPPPVQTSPSNLSDTTNKMAMNEFVDKEEFRKYVALKTFSEEFAKSYQNLLEDERMKKFRFECQKAVNIPVNAISPVSVSHLQDKLTKLHRLLSGQTVEVGKSHFSAAQHPHGIAFCKDLLAKKFVSQGETTVSCKPEAAFAIAAVIVALWTDFPDFGQLLLAHFHKECPYLVPIFLPQLEGETDVEYYKSLGYHYSENGEVEKQDKFLKRMSGIMHLYCAVIVTPLKRSFSRPHPVGMGEAWRWLACLVNMEPRPDICATLLYEFLDVMGNAMFKYYGKMFQKILHLLCTEYYPKIEKITPMHSRGPVARLESFLQKVLKQGQIPPPVGLLPSNFW